MRHGTVGKENGGMIKLLLEWDGGSFMRVVDYDEINEISFSADVAELMDTATRHIGGTGGLEIVCARLVEWLAEERDWGVDFGDKKVEDSCAEFADAAQRLITAHRAWIERIHAETRRGK